MFLTVWQGKRKKKRQKRRRESCRRRREREKESIKKSVCDECIRIDTDISHIGSKKYCFVINQSRGTFGQITRCKITLQHHVTKLVTECYLCFTLFIRSESEKRSILPWNKILTWNLPQTYFTKLWSF